MNDTALNDVDVVQIEGSFGIDHLAKTQRSMSLDPSHGQVVLKMRAASINFRDYLMVEGLYNPRQPLPLIPCSDGVGEVIAMGAGVDRVATGDRVMPCFAQGWISEPFPSTFKDMTLGGPLDGTLSAYMVVDQAGVVKAPDYLNDSEASTLPCAAVTAWNAIVEQGQVRRGDVVVVQGTGGVALFALQFAVAAGAEVIVTSKSDEKLEQARRMGASRTVNYVDTPEWSRTVKSLTDGRGADHVIELGGSATLKQSVRAVRSGGFVSMIGVLSGPVAEIELPLVVMRNVRLQGVTVGSRDSFERMVTFMETNAIRPVVDTEFDFEDAVSAFRYLERGEHMGKIVVSLT